MKTPELLIVNPYLWTGVWRFTSFTSRLLWSDSVYLFFCSSRLDRRRLLLSSFILHPLLLFLPNSHLRRLSHPIDGWCGAALRASIRGMWGDGGWRAISKPIPLIAIMGCCYRKNSLCCFRWFFDCTRTLTFFFFGDDIKEGRLRNVLVWSSAMLAASDSAEADWTSAPSGALLLLNAASFWSNVPKLQLSEHLHLKC